jgi:hypothetical protein
MCDAMRGEHIARRNYGFNVRDRSGVGTLKGLSRPMFILRYEQGLGQSENRAILWGAGKQEEVASFR